MKLKDGFVLHDVGTEHMAVTTGLAAESFDGIVRNNDTAHFIFEQLLKDTTEEQIVDAMAQRYDAPLDLIQADVHRHLAQLRAEGFLEE